MTTLADAIQADLNDLLSSQPEPKTKSNQKIEYVPLQNHDPRIVAATFLDQDLYYPLMGRYRKVKHLAELGGRTLYKKVVTDVTWLDAAKKYVAEPSHGGKFMSEEAIVLIKNIAFGTEQDFIGLCHVVAEHTNKPE